VKDKGLQKSRIKNNCYFCLILIKLSITTAFMLRKVVILVLCACIYQMAFVPAYAVKAYPFPLSITQPDGTQLTIRLQGDESRHYQTTEDGYLLKTNAKGFLTYATLNTAGKIVESNYPARNINKRTASEVKFLNTISKSAVLERTQSASPLRIKSAIQQQNNAQSAFPLTGSPKSLIILVNFRDNAYVTPTPQTAFTNLLNQDSYSANGGTGSARDYFMAASYGKFAPEFDVVGPYTLPSPMAYYGANNGSGNDLRPEYMIADACTAADSDGLDFTQYDTDNDGVIDNVFVYYAGNNEAEGASANTIWPHRWNLSDAAYPGNRIFDGKILNDYACTSELKGSGGSSMCGIGTFCHEFGHVLGLPDYYHTTSTVNINTLNEWSIMDYGSYTNAGCTPPTYSVFDRFFLGWLTPKQVSTGSDLTLLPIYQGKTQPANTNNQAYLFSATTHNLNGANPNPTEFFMVEYRKLTGWDTYLPAEGMVIWHIDYNQIAWRYNMPNNYIGPTQTASSHMRIYIQPLSGSATTPGTAFTSGSFSPLTWSGTNINRAITAITKTSDSITFKLMGGTPGPTITPNGTVNTFVTTVGTPSDIQSLDVSGIALTGDVQIALTDKTHFDIKLSSESSWAKSLTLTPVSGTISDTIQIQYNPTAAGIQAEKLTFTSSGATSVNLNLNGTASVPYDPNTPLIIVGKVDSLIQFPVTKLNTAKTKAFNIKTTDITDTLTLAVTGTDAAMFTVSASTLTKEEVNAANGTSITVNYKPTSTGSHSATLTVSGGGLDPAKVITLQGEGK
jgi:M6 family metalloprotease-like protein